MKLLFFDDFKLGSLKGDAVVDVSAAVRGIAHTGPHDAQAELQHQRHGAQDSTLHRVDHVHPYP